MPLEIDNRANTVNTPRSSFLHHIFHQPQVGLSRRSCSHMTEASPSLPHAAAPCHAHICESHSIGGNGHFDPHENTVTKKQFKSLSRCTKWHGSSFKYIVMAYIVTNESIVSVDFQINHRLCKGMDLIKSTIYIFHV